MKKYKVSITKKPMRGTRPIISWYEEYRINDDSILKIVNNIWKNINNKREYKT